jgi:Protein of unknown function (DUF2802).
VSFWVLSQVLVNIILLAGIVGMWVRLNRPPKDDPRLSKGLQLLQSKIAILEDLSDRTETQVTQLTALLEQKVKDIQAKIQSSEKQISKIDQSMQKSLEVAKIFQDRIPHTEILERQNTIKYVKAARLAHQGLSVDEIAAQITDLSRGEIEFIAKVNRDQLMFCEDSLPEWANNDAEVLANDENEVEEMSFHSPLQKESVSDISNVFEVPKADTSSLKKLGDAFKAACDEVEAAHAAPVKSPLAPLAAAMSSISAKMPEFIELNPMADAKPNAAAPQAKATPPPKNLGAPNIRPVEFRKIDLAKDLG